MLEKEDFYHGAALIRLLENSACESIRRREQGYVLNGRYFVLLKYTTKSRGPWRFTFSDDEAIKLDAYTAEYDRILVGLICAGDGICGLDYCELLEILGSRSGWVAVKRDHGKQYGVSGPSKDLDRKIPRQRWQQLPFGNEQDVESNSK